MATSGSSGKSQENRSKGKWKTTTDLKPNFCSNQHGNRSEDGTRKHITCYCCGYPGHFTQECPRWNGSITSPLGFSDGRQDGRRMHITCNCCGYPGHFTQECPRWNGPLTAPLGSSDGRQETQYSLTLNSYQQNIENRYCQDQMDGIITCLVCGEEGHYTCDCPMKDRERKVICTLCSKKGHCYLWCCQQNKSENNKSENLACTRCGEIGHSASTNGLSCSSCDEHHPHGECRMSEVTCFICDSRDHYLAQCPLNSALTAVCKDQRENLQAALQLALSKQGNSLSTPAKPSVESQVCKPSFAKKSAGKKPKSRKCYSCGEGGHFANGCISISKVPTPSKSNPEVRTGNTTTRVLKTICLKCNEEGHHGNHCPQKSGATSANLSRELEESSTIPTSSNLCKELKEQDPLTAKHSSEMKPVLSAGCFICSEEGHRAFSCPLRHPALTPDKSSPLVTVDNIPARLLICYSCGEEGHKSNQCSQKRQKRQKR